MTGSFANSTLSPALRQAAHGVDVPEDPWPGFARRERRHQRTRLIRTAVAAAVGVALVGVQTNVVPLPGWAPGIAVAATPTALLDAPPRGALAGDRAWLDTLRTRISADPPVRIDAPVGGWKIGDRDRIRLIYGSDQPGHRVALVAVPLRFGLLTREALVWYVGPAGAGAQQMRYGGHSEGDDDPVMTLMQAYPDRAGFAVVVGPPESTVTISGDPRYTSRGTVEYQDIARADGGGVGFAVLPPRTACRTNPSSGSAAATRCSSRAVWAAARTPRSTRPGRRWTPCSPALADPPEVPRSTTPTSATSSIRHFRTATSRPSARRYGCGGRAASTARPPRCSPCSRPAGE